MNARWVSSFLAVGLLLLGPDRSSADQAEDEAAIRKCVESYSAAFNKRDAGGLAAHWLPDAIYIDPESGVQVVGRAAIEKHFASEFKQMGKARLNVTVDSIRFISPHVAVENGAALLVAKGQEAVQSRYSAIHVKKDGKWLLDRVTEEAAIPDPVSHYENLKELEWMVGTWIDAEDDRTTIETTCSWAKNRNFLVRTFNIQVGDRITASGVQIIGWDPSTKKIRSWVFDSAGGHGEGFWTRKGKAWHIRTQDTLPTGEKATAVHVLTVVDGNSFTWQSMDRQAGGFLLPNVAAVTVVRAANDKR